MSAVAESGSELKSAPAELMASCRRGSLEASALVISSLPFVAVSSAAICFSAFSLSVGLATLLSLSLSLPFGIPSLDRVGMCVSVAMGDIVTTGRVGSEFKQSAVRSGRYQEAVPPRRNFPPTCVRRLECREARRLKLLTAKRRILQRQL